MKWHEDPHLSAEKLNEMTPLEAALAMATIGLKLIPVCPSDHVGVSERHAKTCRNPGKAPRIVAWGQKATDDSEVLSDWFLKWPNGNIGILTGAKVGLIAVDIDGGYGRERMDDLFDGNVPVTWHFITPGGERYLFAVPSRKSLTKYQDAPTSGRHEEFSVLADGQMTVVPPSIHSSGGRYQWTPGRGPGEVPLADAPPQLLSLLSRPHPAAEPPGSNSNEGGSREARRIPHHLMRCATPSQTTGNAALDELTARCEKFEKLCEQQRNFGCDEETWFRATSMLVRADHPDAALTFSRLSQKHDEHSVQRIEKMIDGIADATYGPTRCTTFGCVQHQIERCFGTAHRNNTGEITNSPAEVLADRPAESSSVNPVDSTEFNEKVALLPSRYSVNEHHLCLVSIGKDGKPQYSPQTNFFAWISQEIVRDDGAERVRFYELRGVILASGRVLRPIKIPAAEFEGMKWLTEWGPEPNLLPGHTVRDTVRYAIQCTATQTTRKLIFAHLGWVFADGRWVYLHANGAVGAKEVEVELNDGRLSNYRLPNSVGDPKAAMEASLRLLEVAPLQVTVVLWSLVYLSVLCERLRWANLEPKFLIWLHG